MGTTTHETVAGMPGPLHWGADWRRWNDGTDRGAWAAPATAAFWNAWSHATRALIAIGIGVRKTRDRGWWITWRGPFAMTRQQGRAHRIGPDPLQHDLRTAMQMLATADADHARVRNGVGFNRHDSASGHRLAHQEAWGADQLDHAWRMMRKYQRQIGTDLHRRLYGEPPQHQGRRPPAQRPRGHTATASAASLL